MSQLLLTAKDGYSFSGATAAGDGRRGATARQSRIPGQRPRIGCLFIASGYGVRAAPCRRRFPTWMWPDHRETSARALPSAKGKPLPLQ